MDNYGYYISSIEEVLRGNKRGMTVSELALRLSMSRNTIGKYLELMFISGVVDVRSLGKAKLYYLSPRVPVTRVLSYLSDTVIQTDDRYRIISVNLPALDLLSADEEDLTGRNLLDILTTLGLKPDMRARITDPSRDAAFTAETELRKIEKPLQMLITVADMVMYDGVHGHTFLFEDVTEWKEAAEGRRLHEFLFSTLAGEASERVCVFGPDLLISYANGRYAEAAGKPADEIPGESRIALGDAQSSRVIRNAVESVITEVSPKRIVFPATEHGESCWVDERLYPVTDKDGATQSILSISREITGFQEGGSASSLLPVLLMNMAEGVITVTPSGTILTWNRGAEMITGYPAEELITGNAQIIIPPDLNGRDIVADAAKGDTIRDLRMTIRAKGGRKKKVLMTTAQVPDAGGNTCMLVLIWREP
ncbi:MAG TPA: PAS domain S-box protein [Methanospirillum sp.]|nr:PAS domain S-box protein [Methanospirillum sp.]